MAEEQLQTLVILWWWLSLSVGGAFVTGVIGLAVKKALPWLFLFVVFALSALIAAISIWLQSLQ